MTHNDQRAGRSETVPQLDSPLRCVVADPDKAQAALTASSLVRHGWTCRIAHTGKEALGQARNFAPEAFVLDPAMPDLNGSQVLARLRRLQPGVVVMVVSSQSGSEDRIAALHAGADDYLIKPLDQTELAARMHGLARQTGLVALPGTQLVYGDLAIDDQQREVHRNGHTIKLTRTEFDLLRFLARNAGRLVSQIRILDAVWRFEPGHDTHVVELYVSTLRRKLSEHGAPVIHTVRGRGYIFKPTEESA